MILRPTPTVIGHLTRASLSSRTTVACSSAVLRHSRHLATAVSPVRPTSPIQPPSKEPNEPQIPYAFQEPPVRPPTHNIPVATLHLRSHHVDRLRLFLHFALHAAYAMNIPCTHPTYLPTKRSLITVVKSPFIFKKTQENFEEKVHKRLVKVYDTHPLVLSQWLQYLQANAMAGVGIKVIKWEREEFGFGKDKLLVDAVKRTRSTAMSVNDEVKALAEGIVKQEMKAAASNDTDVPVSKS